MWWEQPDSYMNNQYQAEDFPRNLRELNFLSFRLLGILLSSSELIPFTLFYPVSDKLQ